LGVWEGLNDETEQQDPKMWGRDGERGGKLQKKAKVVLGGGADGGPPN